MVEGNLVGNTKGYRRIGFTVLLPFFHRYFLSLSRLLRANSKSSILLREACKLSDAECIPRLRAESTAFRALPSDLLQQIIMERKISMITILRSSNKRLCQEVNQSDGLFIGTSLVPFFSFHSSSPHPYFSKLRASSGVSPGMQETMSSIFQRDPRPVHHAGITGLINDKSANNEMKDLQSRSVASCEKGTNITVKSDDFPEKIFNARISLDSSARILLTDIRLYKTSLSMRWRVFTDSLEI
ncbi:hypothetical protein V1478_005893 [Vespula squamosa]|uniref:Uncharacterized protein n=1 Tax=Vespula squamosa TaxID=30214 RepID=A0ABD2BAP8_VESSQ